MSNYVTISRCRVCGSPKLTPLFSLGTQYVSDFPVPGKAKDGLLIPIEIVLCPVCTLVQAKHTPPPDLLYRKHYWYRSGVTKTMRKALADVVHAALDLVKLESGDVVLDIGSNDGTLLRNYPAKVVKVGVEPADNLATEENYRGLGLVHDFWPNGFWNGKYHAALIDNRILEKLSGHGDGAKIITACGMFYDLDDPNPFIAGVAKALAPDGVFIAQLMCLKQTLEKKDVGNFAHEHLEFYSLRALARLFNSWGLRIFDLEENAVNGGSYRVHACHANCARYHARPIPPSILEGERSLHDPSGYLSFFQELEWNKARVANFIRTKVAEGKSVWVYGASTKGNVILQYYGLDHYGDGCGAPRLIEAAADRSPEKWGRVTAGTGIPVVSEEEFRKAKLDYALVLPYAFLPEFIEREKIWLEGGGQFIVPLPEPGIVNGRGAVVPL